MYKTKEIHSYTKIINKSMLYAITGFALVLMLPISYVFAVPPLSGFLNAEGCDRPKDIKSGDKVSCCWIENPAEGIEFVKCQTCTWTHHVGFTDCSKGQIMLEQHPSEDGVLEQSPTTQPSGPAAPLQDGVLEQTETPTTQTPGQSILPGNEGGLEQPEEEEETSNNGNIKNNPLGNEELREQ